jgi:hypothetical protein
MRPAAKLNGRHAHNGCRAARLGEPRVTPTAGAPTDGSCSPTTSYCSSAACSSMDRIAFQVLSAPMLSSMAWTSKGFAVTEDSFGNALKSCIVDDWRTRLRSGLLLAAHL